MKMPIPNDWDGVTLCSYCVQWPDSTLWRIIFRGLISNPMLAPFWDERTGDLAQVLADFEPTLDFNLNNLECGDMNIPIGTIFISALDHEPAGFLFCDGQSVGRTDYPALFFEIGITYGDGDGSTTFELPNLNGRVPVGFDAGQTEFDTLGETGGEKTHTLTSTEMPSHTHVQNAHTHIQNSHNHTQDSHTHPIFGKLDGPTGTTTRTVKAGSDTSNTATGSATATNQAATATNQNATPTNQNTGGGGAHNNLQPYITLNYIIRAL